MTNEELFEQGLYKELIDLNRPIIKYFERRYCGIHRLKHESDDIELLTSVAIEKNTNGIRYKKK